MKGVSFSIKANPLYPSSNDIDFLMCFRYTKYSIGTTLKRTESSVLASVSLINSYIIRLRTTESSTSTDTSTYFKIGLLNYYDNIN